MSTRREHESAIPDRLPGEEDIARLYQQAEHGADEQPAAALDAVILAEARRAVRPRLRLIKGAGRFGQITRRWAVPLSLAAALLISIGVVTNLKEDIDRPLSRLDSASAPSVSSSAHEAQPLQQKVGKKAKQAQSPPAADAAAQLKDEAPDVTLTIPAAPLKKEGKKRVVPQRQRESRYEENERDVQLLEKGESGADMEADRRLMEPAVTPQVRPQEEAESGVTGSLMGQRGNRAMSPMMAAERSPKDWLEQIDELFRKGKRREAEDSLRTFQERYPDYTDYPDSFPEDVLERLRTR